METLCIYNFWKYQYLYYKNCFGISINNKNNKQILAKRIFRSNTIKSIGEI